jgi:hypothetical protein
MLKKLRRQNNNSHSNSSLGKSFAKKPQIFRRRQVDAQCEAEARDERANAESEDEVREGSSTKENGRKKPNILSRHSPTRALVKHSRRKSKPSSSPTQEPEVVNELDQLLATQIIESETNNSESFESTLCDELTLLTSTSTYVTRSPIDDVLGALEEAIQKGANEAADIVDTIGGNIEGTWEQFSFWLTQLVSDNSTIATDWTDEKQDKVQLIKEKSAGKLLDIIETEDESCKNENVSDKETQVSDDIITQVQEFIDNFMLDM